MLERDLPLFISFPVCDFNGILFGVLSFVVACLHSYLMEVFERVTGIALHGRIGHWNIGPKFAARCEIRGSWRVFD